MRWQDLLGDSQLHYSVLSSDICADPSQTLLDRRVVVQILNVVIFEPEANSNR